MKKICIFNRLFKRLSLYNTYTLYKVILKIHIGSNEFENIILFVLGDSLFWFVNLNNFAQDFEIPELLIEKRYLILLTCYGFGVSISRFILRAVMT